MRTKEGSSDYRYFAEPDLVPMVMTPEWVATISDRLPELPADRRARYRSQGISEATAGILSSQDPTLRAIFHEAVLSGASPKSAQLGHGRGDRHGCGRRKSIRRDADLDGPGLAELIEHRGGRSGLQLRGKGGAGGGPGRRGPPPPGGRGSRSAPGHRYRRPRGRRWPRCSSANPRAIDEFRSGEEKVLGFLVGQVMKATQGKADPRSVERDPQGAECPAELGDRRLPSADDAAAHQDHRHPRACRRLGSRHPGPGRSRHRCRPAQLLPWRPRLPRRDAGMGPMPRPRRPGAPSR